MILETIAIILAGVHFGIPLLYYVYLKHAHLNKRWNIRINESYKPKVTIIVPTYNEAKFIRGKLDNLYSQDYQKSSMEIIVVDSKSNDGTVDLVKEWAYKHIDVDLKLLEEPERRGMVSALNYALTNCKINGEIVVFTDVDAFWDIDALAKITKYFADPNVGAVTASIIPTTQADNFLEGAYRNYYNQVRIAESKIHSTPVHNGALVAFRIQLIYKMGGLPSYTGNNDSTPASIVAFMGYRAIQVDDVMVKEPVRGGQFYRKVRRAQHLLLSFLKTKRYVKKLGVYRNIEPFEKIWKMEWWLHVVNPLFLAASVILLVMSTLYASFTAITFLGIGIILLVLKAYRTWVLQQLYLIIAAVRNLWTREIAWSK
jgi:cellulose synthase/poly-beta-1,6-N-acetylglucosamine synthase-like glycosyltransferase